MVVPFAESSRLITSPETRGIRTKDKVVIDLMIDMLTVVGMM